MPCKTGVDAVFNEFADDAVSLLDKSFALRDSEQLLVKVSWRFEK